MKALIKEYMKGPDTKKPDMDSLMTLTDMDRSEFW